MSEHFDVVFVADPRFEGGTTTAMAVEMAAVVRAGLRAGLMMVRGPIIGHPFPVHPRLRSLIDSGAVERIDPDTGVAAPLVLVHHPSILENHWRPRPQIAAGTAIVILHHPVTDRAGRRQYDIEAVVRHCRAVFGGTVRLAAVSQVVRASLPLEAPKHCEILESDWTNLIDLDEWPARPPRTPGAPIVIGRHSRPDPLKWPNRFRTASKAYPPDASRFEVRILGGGGYLRELYGPLPANWRLLPFDAEAVAAFLADLDFYVYFHSDEWSEAFGRTILEALATGLVTILPGHFEPIFGDAAVYSRPRDTVEVIERFVADPDGYRAQSARARLFAEQRHAASLLANRIAPYLADGGSVRRKRLPARPLPDRQVMFLSSNGIGVGHLVQQMAVADRLPVGLVPVFATMSHAMKLVQEAGYAAHFINYHRHIGASAERWNEVLAEELFDLFAFHRPSVFAYDATAVFSGVTAAMREFPDAYSIWVRRPMWRQSHAMFLEAGEQFDAVIEPGELADELDKGPTKAASDRVLRVEPVLHLDPAERLDRATARQLLDLPPDARVAALQIGPGNNYDYRRVREAVIDALLAHRDTMVLEILSPIRAEFAGDADRHERHRVLRLFPAFRYSRAFDCAVSAAGYNAFHENVLGGVPTLFVPNEADEMDLQFNRGMWAELNGCGWVMRRDHDLPRVRFLVDRLLDAGERERVARRCRDIDWKNGAVAIARYIEDHARIVRADRSHGHAL